MSNSKIFLTIGECDFPVYRAWRHLFAIAQSCYLLQVSGCRHLSTSDSTTRNQITVFCFS